MRIWSLVVAILVGLAAPAHAKRLACAPSLAAPERIEGTRGELDAPTVQAVSFSREGVWINAQFPPDAVRVRLTYNDGTDHVELWTTPQRPFVCIPRVPTASMLTSVFVFDCAPSLWRALAEPQGHTLIPAKSLIVGVGLPPSPAPSRIWTGVSTG